MSMQVNTGAKPAQLPIILTNRESRLVKAAIAVTELKESNLENKSTWRPMHAMWEREVKRACSSYRPLKGEYFGTLCDSGRDGAPACSQCGKCQFFASVNDTPETLRQYKAHRAPALAKTVPVTEQPLVPVVSMASIEDHAARFGGLARSIARSIQTPAPVVVCEQASAVELQFSELITQTIAAAEARRSEIDPVKAQRHTEAFQDSFHKALKLLPKLPAAQQPRMLNVLSWLPV